MKEVKEKNPIYDDLAIGEDQKNLSIDVLEDITKQIENENIGKPKKN